MFKKIYNKFIALVGYRNLDKQTQEIYETKEKEKQRKLLAKLESEDRIAGSSEAGSKFVSNTLLMLATIGFLAASSLLGAPMWVLGLGITVFTTTFIIQTIGMLIETNRNQSQSDNITRALYKGTTRGLDISEYNELSKQSSTKNKKLNSKNIVDKISLASNASPGESDAILENAIKKDRNNTRIEQFLKTMRSFTYITALFLIGAGIPYLGMSLTPMIAVAGALFIASFISDTIASVLESKRNTNQTVGLRRLTLLNQYQEKSIVNDKQFINGQKVVEDLNPALNVADNATEIPSRPSPAPALDQVASAVQGKNLNPALSPADNATEIPSRPSPASALDQVASAIQGKNLNPALNVADNATEIPSRPSPASALDQVASAVQSNYSNRSQDSDFTKRYQDSIDDKVNNSQKSI